jgi:hypothetical protein
MHAVQFRLVHSKSADKITLFNTRFHRWGVEINTASNTGKDLELIQVKGEQAKQIIHAVASEIKRSPLKTGQKSINGYQFEATEDCLLRGIDDDPDTLAMWWTANEVFKVGRDTLYPTRQEIKNFPSLCADALVAFRVRASRARFVPDYVHILYVHGPLMLKWFGTLNVVSNQDTEAMNKEVLSKYTRTQHGGSVGRISEEQKRIDREMGVMPDHSYGRGNQNEGLRGVVEAFIIETSCLKADVMHACRKDTSASLHAPDQQRPAAGATLPSPPAARPPGRSPPSTGKSTRQQVQSQAKAARTWGGKVYRGLGF